MARIRYVKPGFFEDEAIADLSPLARLLYIGLWCFMDRQGICEDRPKLIKRNIFPYDDKIGLAQIRGMLDELVKAGRLVRVEHEGKPYLVCPRFAAHQKFHPKEEAQFSPEITREVTKKVASNLQASDQTPASSVGIGIGIGIGIGMGTGTGAAGREAARPGAGLDFDSVWKKYPRKTDKTDARERFHRMIRTEEDYNLLHQAIERYRAYLSENRTEEKHIKHFTTFLGTEDKPRWKDPLDPDFGEKQQFGGEVFDIGQALERRGLA